MRARVIFRLQNRGGVVPFHHQHVLAQLIKGLIVRENKKEFLNFKTYNFSGLKGQTKISRKGLHFFSSKITLVLSSPDKNFIDHFLSTLFSHDEIEVGNLRLVPESVELEEPVITNGPVKIVCISPVVLVKPVFGDQNTKKFIHPEADFFSDQIFDSTIMRMSRETNYSEKEIDSFYKFQIVPDNAYISRMDKQQKKYARIYSVFDDDVKYEVRGYTFPFTLYAEKEVLEFLFNCGMGYFCHKGFGMIDLAEQENSKKFSKYEVNVSSTGTVH